MVIEAKIENIKEVVDFSWELACCKDRCNFPKFKSYEDMYNSFLKSIQNGKRLLVCYENGKIVGTLNLLAINEHKFIQAEGGIFTKKDFDFIATQFIDYLSDNYTGYEFYSGYPKEHKDAINFFNKINAKLIDASFTMELKKEDFIRNFNDGEVDFLEVDKYDEYAVFHDKHNHNIYWNSERIFENIDIWQIYTIIKNQNIIGSIFIKVKNKFCEVFGISIDKEYEKQGLELKLLSASMNHILEKDLEEILYFIDEYEDDKLQAALSIGFKQIDTYRSYKISL